MNGEYDVIIVGAGPAGIFAALELLDGSDRRVLVLEKGRGIEKRRCPSRQAGCIGCKTCDIMTGWGGAGAFSDGKLTLTGEIGGWLGEYVGVEALDDLLQDADDLWLRFGADPFVHAPDPGEAARLQAEAAAVDMQLVPMRIRHLGTDRSPEVLQAMRLHLEASGVEVRTTCAVARIMAEGHGVTGVELADGSRIHAPVVIAAPGREGADWLATQATELGVGLANNAVDIGVRVECPAYVMEPLTEHLYEAKLLYRSHLFGDKVRTFCMNPYGEVTTESYGDVVTVNGHSYAESRTGFTNFAVLVSQNFTEPFHEPITYGRSIARLANLLGEGILVQRLGDLKAGRRSTPERMRVAGVEPTLPAATPGDLASVLPYRHLTDLLEFFAALDKLAPGIAGEDTLLYGVEVKFYSSRVAVGPDLMTSVQGLYAIGDGAGVTRGLIQSSASGLAAARAVLQASG